MFKRKLKDLGLDTVTYLFSSISIILLITLFVFIIQRGYQSINLSLFTTPYWSENYYASIPESNSTYPLIEEFDGEVYYSENYGIALKNDYNARNEAIVVIEYLHPDSPFNSLINETSGPNFGKIVIANEGMILNKISYLNQNGVLRSAGPVVKQDAKATIETINTSNQLDSVFIQTQGGGITGSLIATLMLILISLLISLPIGIMTALYLNEYAKFNRFTPWIRSSIELLTGVPSIIFGLMGVLVLFPITAAFGATGTSIMLGGMTLSIILLPIIIRTTEESLKVVPDGLREASMSLGANQSQTIFKIVLPSALPGIMTATILSIGRIIGESAALIYTMGTFISDKPEILKGATSLAVQIWSIMNGDQPNFGLASAISIIILVMVLIMNLSVKLLTRKRLKRW
jgi:phosphate transport system permease protein